MHRRPPGQAANNQSNQQMARPSRFRNGSATTNDHGIIVRLSLLKNLSIIGNRSSSITSLEEGGFVPTTKVNFLPSRLPRSNRIEELHPRTSIAQQSILRRLHILLQIPIMTHSSNDDIMLKSHDDVAVLRRSCQQGSSSLLMKKSRRRDMHLLFAMIAIILTSMLASVVEGANNNHSGNNGGSGGTGGSGSGNNHHNSMNGGGGNSGQGGGDAADEEPESFEAPVNITLLPNSKQISYWMYSMKTPGHIDMRHLLFHSTDDKNNIADGTKNSAVSTYFVVDDKANCSCIILIVSTRSFCVVSSSAWHSFFVIGRCCCISCRKLYAILWNNSRRNQSLRWWVRCTSLEKLQLGN